MENRLLNDHLNEGYSEIAIKQWSPISTVNYMPERSILATSKKTYSEVFSTSKRTGKNLWELLSPILPDVNSKMARQSLDIAIYQWLLTHPLQNNMIYNSVPFVSGFQFNDEFTLDEINKLQFDVARNGDNSLTLINKSFNPAKDIPAPLKTETFSFKIMAVSCNVNEGLKTGCYITEVQMPYADLEIKPQQIHLPLSAAKDNLLIIAMTIEYCMVRDGKQQIVHNRRWTPSGIIWAGYN